MALRAEQLSKAGTRGKELDVIVREQLQIIDDRLTKADRTWGRNVVPYELPESFNFPGLEKKQAQRIIYTSIIKSLEERGFEVALVLESNRNMIYIAWESDITEEQVDAMNRTIRRVRIDADKIDSFRSKSTASPAKKE